MAALAPPSIPSPDVSGVAASPNIAQPRSRGGVTAATLRRIITATMFFVALVFAWHLYVQSLPPARQVILPEPLSVWNYLVTAFKDGDLLSALRVTMSRLLLG